MPPVPVAVALWVHRTPGTPWEAPATRKPAGPAGKPTGPGGKPTGPGGKAAWTAPKALTTEALLRHVKAGATKLAKA